MPAKNDIYESNDPREKRRQIRLLVLETHHDTAYWMVENVLTGRQTRIREDRLGTTKRSGYTRVAP